MKTLSLKLEDSVFGETEKILSDISIPRNRYINDAVKYYNKIQKMKLLEKQLREESEMVQNESIRVLNDFEKIDYAD